MSILKRLQSLNLSDDAMVTLTFEEGADVFHFNESEVEDAINETSVISEFASLIANSKLDARNQWCGNVIEHLREQMLLDDYERGSFEFEEYLADTIAENFYDHDLIEYSTEKYDHKRGFTTLTATVKVNAENLIQCAPPLFGWKAQVQTEKGVLVLS